MWLEDNSVIFSPCGVAFGAFEETRFRLIRRSELSEPPICNIVPAFRTSGRCGGKTLVEILFKNSDFTVLTLGF